MSKLLYFAYGSNLHPQWLRSRTPSAKVLSVESSPNFNLSFNKHGLDDSGKCNIIKSDDPADIVHGVVYQFDAVEKAVLDEAERGYRQEIINIGNYENVLIYIAEETVSGYSSPYSWYRDIVIAGARLHQFPEFYIEHIRSFTAVKDPDETRELKHRKITGL